MNNNTTSPPPTTPSLNDGDTAWVLMCCGLVMLMIPGLGYFYSGLARHNNALSLIFLSMLSLSIVSIQWWMWGYSLAFSPDSGPFIGNLNYAFYMGMFETGDRLYFYPQVPTIPGSVFMLFQGMFAAITPALALGASAERTRIVPAILFLFIWSTLVYDFIAYWTWAPNGWLRVLGALDFAGGSPVHIASGAAGLGLAYSVGKRQGYGKQEFKPHNLSSVFLGTALLWFGWFGFNGGSELAANGRAVIAIVNTNLSACVGAMVWVFLDYGKHRHFSAFAFCSGAVCGMVVITPAAGYVYPWSAALFGVIGTACCYLFLRAKHHFGFDDALDSFGVHGVGGIVGNLLTGIFASKQIASLNGSQISGGFIDGNYIQLVYQLVSCVATFAWSFVLTAIIVFCMNRLPFFGWRLSVDDEVLGVDLSQMNARAYDYIEAAVGRSDSTAGLTDAIELGAVRDVHKSDLEAVVASNQ